MSTLRKILIGGVMLMTVLSMSIVVAPQAKAAAAAGDLIKISGLSSVYYLGANGKRYVFPNEATYFSWYKDFSGVVTIPASEMEGYPLAANVLVRPGTKLVKSPSINTVYAVEANGVLRSIVSEANAISLWGANWAKMVIDVPDSFFVNYSVGAPLALGQYPVGQLIKTAGSPDVMVLAADGTARKFASQAAFDSNNYSFNYVATVPSAYVMPTTGALINGMESALDTVSQNGASVGPVAGGSGVSVALASDTPAASSIASGTPASLLKFNLTASNDGAAAVNSITLTAGGLSVANQITNIVLYANGVRIGNVKSVLDSNRQAIFNLATPLAIAAGQTVSVTVKAVVTNTNSYNLTVAKASDINVGGASVSGSFPITGNTISGVAITVGKLTINNNGTPSDVNLGATNAVIGQFKMQADGTEDITLNSITLQRSNGTSVNSDFANVTLYYNGAAISAPTTFAGKSNGYATFMLTSPLVIKKSQTALFEVHADIIDGRSGDTTSVALDSSVDVDAIGNTYGQAVQIAAGSTEFATSYSTTFAIKAGTIALAKQDAANDKTKNNTTNVVFGTLKLTSNSATGATFDTLKATIKSTGDTPTVGAFNYLQNVKLVNEETGASFDLTAPTSGTSLTELYGALNNIGMTLTSGKTYSFDLEGDITSGATTQSYQFSIVDAGTTGLIVHDQNNAIISDVTPSALNFNAVTVQQPAVTFSVNPLSTSYSQVVGTSNVTALDFNVQANQTSNLKIQELDFYASSSGTYATKSQVSEYSLYKGTTLIKQVSGSSISALGIVTFNGLSETVSANVTNEYTVTVDLSSDSAQAGKRVQVGLIGYNVIDSDSNNVYDAVNDSNKDNTFNAVTTLLSARKIVLVATGSLYVQMDNSDSNTNKDTIQVDGSTTSYLAAIKLRATNESVKIQDLNVNVLAAGVLNTSANKMFSSLTIVDPANSNNNVTVTSIPASGIVAFTGFNQVVPMSTETLYLKGTLTPFGKDQVNYAHASSSFTISGISNAKGVSSNQTLTEATTSINGTPAAGTVAYARTSFSAGAKVTDSSKTVMGVASRISSVDLVTSATGCSIASSLSGGPNTIAIIKVTTDANSNTLQSGDVVKTVLSKVSLDVIKNATTTFSTWTLQRCGGLGSSTAASTNVTTANGQVVFGNMANLGSDAQIPAASTYYYAIKGTVGAMQTGTGNDWVEGDLNNLDSNGTANIAWLDSADNAGAIGKLLLTVNQIPGTKIVEP